MFEQCLYFSTTSLARQLERQWSRAFKPFGLTPPQAFMLRVILAKQTITSTDLAMELRITKATCSRGVDGLVRLGLVEKVSGNEDGRSFDLHATAQAQRIHADLNHASGAVTKRIKKTIGADAFEGTVNKLQSITALIDEVPYN